MHLGCDPGCRHPGGKNVFSPCYAGPCNAPCKCMQIMFKQSLAWKRESEGLVRGWGGQSHLRPHQAGRPFWPQSSYTTPSATQLKWRGDRGSLAGGNIFPKQPPHTPALPKLRLPTPGDLGAVGLVDPSPCIRGTAVGKVRSDGPTDSVKMSVSSGMASLVYPEADFTAPPSDTEPAGPEGPHFLLR